jgi:hypothetical protein
MSYSLGILSCESLLYDSLFSAPKSHFNPLPLPAATGFRRPTNLVIFWRQNITTNRIGPMFPAIWTCDGYDFRYTGFLSPFFSVYRNSDGRDFRYTGFSEPIFSVYRNSGVLLKLRFLWSVQPRKLRHTSTAAVIFWRRNITRTTSTAAVIFWRRNITRTTSAGTVIFWRRNITRTTSAGTAP